VNHGAKSHERIIKPKVCYFCGNLSRETLGEWRPPRTLAQVEQDAKESGGQTCLKLCWIASDFVSRTKTPVRSFINYNINIKVYKLLVISFI
jgi:hypothetical protein